MSSDSSPAPRKCSVKASSASMRIDTKGESIVCGTGTADMPVVPMGLQQLRRPIEYETRSPSSGSTARRSVETTPDVDAPSRTEMATPASVGASLASVTKTMALVVLRLPAPSVAMIWNVTRRFDSFSKSRTDESATRRAPRYESSVKGKPGCPSSRREKRMRSPSSWSRALMTATMWPTAASSATFMLCSSEYELTKYGASCTSSRWISSDSVADTPWGSVTDTTTR